jgi:hypothetical protein
VRNTNGKGHGSKAAVPRHRTQSRSAADRQERAVEKQARRAARRDIEERVVTTTDEWGRTVVVGGHITVRLA